MSHVGVRGGDDRQPHVGQTQTYPVADWTTQRPPLLHGRFLSHMVSSMSRRNHNVLPHLHQPDFRLVISSTSVPSLLKRRLLCNLQYT